MTSRVRLRHPDTEAEIEVPERAVDVYARSGWKPADGPPDDGPALAEPPAEPPAMSSASESAASESPLDAGGQLEPGLTQARNTSGPSEPVLAEDPAAPKTRRRKPSPKED